MDTSFTILVTISALLLTFFFLTRTSKLKERGTHPLPPGPLGLPILGYLPFLRPDLHEVLKELADVHGPVLCLRLGAKLCVVLTSPDSAKEALKENDAVFANHDAPAVAVVSSFNCRNILWAPYGDHWRKLRKIAVRELLCSATLDGLYNVRRNVVRGMIKTVKEREGEMVNLRELAAETAMTSTTEMLWGGYSLHGVEMREGLEREFRRRMDEVVDLFGVPNLSDFFPGLAWMDVQGLVRRMRKISGEVYRVLDVIIQQRVSAIEEAARSQGITTVVENRKDFLQVLLDLKQSPDLQSTMTMDVIKALLLDMVAAGTDTTSTTVEWAMAELLYHPDKMKRAKEEISSVVGMGNGVEEAHLPRLTYLNAVFKEVLRLHPVLPLLVPHSPGSTCTISGYTIPKGTKVFINVWAIQRDPMVWDNATEFIPERFLNGAGSGDFNGSNFSYLPFGAGRRICAGVSLGERMVMFILASLLHSAEWILPEGGGDDKVSALKGKFGLVMRKETALVAIPTSCELQA